MLSTARFTSDKAETYFTQMVRHFGHKIKVTAQGNQAKLTFICGTGWLTVSADTLDLRAEAADDLLMRETKSVLERHLLRFAHREDPQPLVWSENR